MQSIYKLVAANGDISCFLDFAPEDVLRLCQNIATNVVDYINTRSESDELNLDNATIIYSEFGNAYLKLLNGKSIPEFLRRVEQDGYDLYLQHPRDLEKRFILACVMRR